MASVHDKLERVRKHYEKHKQDKKAIRDRERIAAQLRKLKQYHKIV